MEDKLTAEEKKTSHQIFEEQQAAMSNDMLILQATDALSNLCNTGGKSFTMHVPPRVTDLDMLFSELINRFKETAELQKENDLLKHKLSKSEDACKIAMTSCDFRGNKIAELQKQVDELKKALTEIAQHSFDGNHLKSVIDMKKTASEALKKAG